MQLNNMDPEKRPSPYIWVTWLSGLMSGDKNCEWASWFKAHNKYQKEPSDFDLVKWTASHNRMLRERRDILTKEGFDVYLEGQNSFKLIKEPKIIISGKPDIVAIRDGEAFVEDCKTGQMRGSDAMQVMIYMAGLPQDVPHCKGRTLEGRIIYKVGIVDVPSSKINYDLIELFKNTVMIVGGNEEPLKSPSFLECKFCDIRKTDCPEKIQKDRHEGIQKESNLFSKIED